MLQTISFQNSPKKATFTIRIPKKYGQKLLHRIMTVVKLHPFVNALLASKKNMQRRRTEGIEGSSCISVHVCSTNINTDMVRKKITGASTIHCIRANSNRSTYNSLVREHKQQNFYTLQAVHTLQLLFTNKRIE